MAREAVIQRRIIEALEDVHAYVFKVHQSGYTRKGIADLACCFRGIYIALEVKQPGGRVRPEQIIELKKVRAAGGIGLIVDNVQDVKDLLHDLYCSPQDRLRDVIDDWHHRNVLPTVRTVEI
jgi:hypothetical protein